MSNNLSMNQGMISYRRTRDFLRKRTFLIRSIKDILFLSLGVLSAGFGLESFLIPNKFIDGGATGISLLLSEITAYPLPLFLVLVNIPFILLGFNQLGKWFVIKTILAIIGLAICVTAVPYPVITSDKLLVAVFGGFFLGAGIGLAVRGGGVLDGTEILAIFISRKTSMSVGDTIFLINVIIFSVAAYFLSIETAFYSILIYFSASKTLTFLIEGIEEYIGVTIISPKSEEIFSMVTEKLGRGITVYKGKRGFGKKGHSHSEEMSILYTVVTRLETSRLQTQVEAIDPNAFIIMHNIKDTKGGMIKKRPLAH
ncbi:MAG: YitT family protein [Bacteroidetes bacterium]|nr:YitT family protein [Bacteroidota bacterium]